MMRMISTRKAYESITWPKIDKKNLQVTIRIFIVNIDKASLYHKAPLSRFIRKLTKPMSNHGMSKGLLKLFENKNQNLCS